MVSNFNCTDMIAWVMPDNADTLGCLIAVDRELGSEWFSTDYYSDTCSV